MSVKLWIHAFLYCYAFLVGFNILVTATDDCVRVPFAPRRCYQYFSDEKNWAESSLDCESRGQRLASVENQQLMDFVESTFPRSSVRAWTVWVGLRRAEHKAPDTWTNGQVLHKKAFTRTPAVGREWDQLCTRLSDTNLLDDTKCTKDMTRLCETYKAPTFKLRRPGFVFRNVTAGQEVTSDTALTLLQCTRSCDVIWDCAVIGYKEGKCWLHMFPAEEDFVVTDTVMATYQRIDIST